MSQPIAGISELKSRAGTTPDGLQYRYYSDGSGSVGAETEITKNWDINCAIDKMNDKRKCIIKNDLVFINYGFGSTPLQVCIRYHDFPGRTGAIRLDSGSPIATDQSGCVPGGSIAASLWKASTVKTRGVNWPYDHYRDAEISARGVHGAHLMVVHMQKTLGKLSFDP